MSNDFFNNFLFLLSAQSYISSKFYMAMICHWLIRKYWKLSNLFMPILIQAHGVYHRGNHIYIVWFMVLEYFLFILQLISIKSIWTLILDRELDTETVYQMTWEVCPYLGRQKDFRFWERTNEQQDHYSFVLYFVLPHFCLCSGTSSLLKFLGWIR